MLTQKWNQIDQLAIFYWEKKNCLWKTQIRKNSSIDQWISLFYSALVDYKTKTYIFQNEKKKKKLQCLLPSIQAYFV